MPEFGVLHSLCALHGVAGLGRSVCVYGVVGAPTFASLQYDELVNWFLQVVQ
jgi:hypothetical protein